MKRFFAQVRLIMGNDLRQQWRGNRLSAFVDWGVLAAFCLVVHVFTIAIFSFFRTLPPLQADAAIWWFFAFIMLGAAMNAAIGSLYERADFDLLLSSPVSPAAVLCARLGAIAAVALGVVVLFVPPLLNPAIFVYTPRYLAGYGVWLLLAVACAAGGIVFTLALVRVFGARRARTISQIVAAILGGSVYLIGQLPMILRKTAGAENLERLFRALANHPLFLLPARAGRADPAAFAILTLLVLGLVGMTVWLLARIFVSGVQDVAAIPARAGSNRRSRWNESLPVATFWKDFRLIIRDPLLFTQMLPQLGMLVPTAFGTYSWLGNGFIAPVVFMTALLLSSTLTLIAVGGEECWDLIRMSPASELRMRTSKIAAGLAVPVVILIVAACVVAGMGRPGLGVLILTVSTACSVGICRVSVSTVMPVPRRDIFRARKSTGGSGPGIVARTCATGYLMLTGGGGLCLAASGDYPIAAAVVISLALLGAALCFVYAKFEAIVWRDESVV